MRCPHCGKRMIHEPHASSGLLEYWRCGCGHDRWESPAAYGLGVVEVQEDFMTRWHRAQEVDEIALLVAHHPDPVVRFLAKRLGIVPPDEPWPIGENA